MATRTPISSVPRNKSSTAKPNSESARCKERSLRWITLTVFPRICSSVSRRFGGGRVKVFLAAVRPDHGRYVLGDEGCG